MNKIRAAVLCALAIVLMMAAVPASAATFDLPDDLVTIENQAFLGMTKITGLVNIPSGVTSVGTSAFSGTRAYGFDFPSTVTSIGDQNLTSGYTAYAIVRGSSTTIASTAFSGVKYMFGPSGSTAQSRASSDGITFVPLSQLVLYNNFYYQVSGSTATLLCAKDATTLTGAVTIPLTVNGYTVSKIGGSAFFRCSGLTSIRLPADATVISGALSGATNATVSYYGANLSVTGLSVNKTDIETGESATWTATISGGTAPYSYAWKSYVNGSLNNSFTTTTPTLSLSCTTSSGISSEVTVSVTVTDANGYTATLSGGDLTVWQLGAPMPGRTYRALLIGNSYASSSGISTLTACPNDVKTVRYMLNYMYDTPYSVSLKTELTASGIRSALGSAFSAADSNDVSFFFFSGHGSDNGSIIGTDGYGVTPAQVRDILDDVPGKKIVMFDSCFSGMAIKEDGTVEELTDDEKKALARSFNSSVISVFSSAPRSGELKASNYYVLTASRYDQTSGAWSDISVFTYYMTALCGYNSDSGYLSTLACDDNGDGAISLYEVYSDVYSYTYDYEQYAQVYPSGSKMVLWSR